MLERLAMMQETVLQRWRDAMDITLAELSKRSDISPGYLSQIERGLRIPKNRRLKRLARALGKPLETLEKALREDFVGDGK